MSAGILPGQAPGQAPAKVDFAKDVQPLLRQNCVGCHGPMKQNGGIAAGPEELGVEVAGGSCPAAAPTALSITG